VKVLSVFLKIHPRSPESVIGVCDEECLGQILKQGKFCYNVSEGFFHDKLVSIEDAVKVLRFSKNFNAVGTKIIKALIDEKIIHPDAVLMINGTPVALKIVF
jgi:hypothetical protein